MNPIELTDTIVKRHAALGLDSNVDAAACPSDATPYTITYAAARRLGFIPADAECVARAWERQSQRTGQFDPLTWPTQSQDFLSQPAANFAPCPAQLGLYAVLPDAEWVGRMARAGVPTVQLRYKSKDPEAIGIEVRAAVEAVRGTQSLLFINDHWQAAIEAGAYGVHLGQEDLDGLSPDQLDTLRQSGIRLGLSTHGYAEMCRAASVGPSYIAMGAVFPTTLKAMATPPQGVNRLNAYARLMHNTPTVAIGGIALEHLPQIAASGVGSFAVVRAITGAPDPERAADRLMRAWACAHTAEIFPRP